MFFIVISLEKWKLVLLRETSGGENWKLLSAYTGAYYWRTNGTVTSGEREIYIYI